MSQTKTYFGTSHVIPTNSETNWGTAVTDYLVAVRDHTYGDFQSVTVTGAATTIDLSLGRNITVNLNASTSVTLTNGVNGDRYYFTVIQGASYTLAWTTTVKWRGGSAPTITTGASSVDAICLIKHPTVGYMGEYAQDFS